MEPATWLLPLPPRRRARRADCADRAPSLPLENACAPLRSRSLSLSCRSQLSLAVPACLRACMCTAEDDLTRPFRMQRSSPRSSWSRAGMRSNAGRCAQYCAFVFVSQQNVRWTHNRLGEITAADPGHV